MSALVVGLQSTSLDQAEISLISDPAVAGIILFTRNFVSCDQLQQLTNEIHEINAKIEIMVDHEGGKIQRFREGFTEIPSAHEIQKTYQLNSNAGLERAFEAGHTMAQELKNVGVDLSLAPVLDLHVDGCDVIAGLGRGYGETVNDVISLASQFILGMKAAGMPGGVGKHFPGHSYAKDTHLQIATDDRDFETIMSQEGQIYKELIQHNLLYGIMPAHVIYPKVDDKPAGFSSIWINYLRQEFGFTGKIYSDDLNMKAAEAVGSSLLQQANLAKHAGCDYILICQTPAREIIESGVLALFSAE